MKQDMGNQDSGKDHACPDMDLFPDFTLKYNTHLVMRIAAALTTTRKIQEIKIGRHYPD